MMNAQDVMTRDVITGRPTTPVAEAARLSVERSIPGAAGVVSHLVTAPDLLRGVVV